MTNQVVEYPHNHQPPFYTLEEAREELKLNPAQFRHAIDGQQLQPVVFTPNRKFLVIAIIHPVRDWVGHGIIEYRGHICLGRGHILRIMDGETISAGALPCNLLEISGMKNLNTENPFGSALPINPITEWEEEDYLYNYELEEVLFQHAIPVPKIGKGPLAELYNQISKDGPKEVSELVAKIDPNVKDVEDSLIYDNKVKYSISDLRISQSDIDCILDPESQSNKSGPIKQKPSSPARRKRSNLFIDLLTRIVAENPSIGIQGVWEILREEAEQEVRQYDIDHILSRVDAYCVECESIESGVVTHKRKTIQNRLSKLKRELG